MNFDRPGDESLLNALSRGEKSAFDQIFNQYWQFVYLSAHKRLFDEEAAKDIAQDIFISMWEKRDRLQIENLPAWLYTSVRFKVINHLKTESHALRYSEQLAMLSDDRYIFDAMHEHDLDVIFNYAVSDLPVRARQIFEMSRKREMSVEEIAAELDLSNQTVKNQLSNALKLVKKKLNYTTALTLFVLFNN